MSPADADAAAINRLRTAVRSLQTVIDTHGALSTETHTACGEITTAAAGLTPDGIRAAGITGRRPQSTTDGRGRHHLPLDEV